MDISKLPKLSETGRHAPQPPISAAPPPRSTPERVTAGLGAQVWLALGIGLILMYLGQNFARYGVAKLAGEPHHTNVTWTSGPKAGQEVEYFELEGHTAWTETAIFLFGLAMVFEAGMLTHVFSPLPGKRLVTAVALSVTILATALNLFVCLKLLRIGVTPLLSLLAVAFGGYMAVYELRLLQQLRSGARA